MKSLQINLMLVLCLLALPTQSLRAQGYVTMHALPGQKADKA